MSLLFNTLTVQIDSREKYPIQFPAHVKVEDPDVPRSFKLLPVSIERVALKSGDYRLKEFPDACIIERKASLLELNKNLMNQKDSARQCRAFAKLRDACSYPVLLLETSPWELASNSARLKVQDTDAVMYRLAKASAHYGLHMFWSGRTTSATNRRHLGNLLIMMMFCEGMKAIGADNNAKEIA